MANTRGSAGRRRAAKDSFEREVRGARRSLLLAVALLIGLPVLWLGVNRLRAQSADEPATVTQTRALGAEAVEAIRAQTDLTEEQRAAGWEGMGDARADLVQMRQMMQMMAQGPDVMTPEAAAGMKPELVQAMAGMQRMYTLTKVQDGPEAADAMMAEMQQQMRVQVEAWSEQLDAMEAALLERDSAAPAP